MRQGTMLAELSPPDLLSTSNSNSLGDAVLKVYQNDDSGGKISKESKFL
jgi:hypothetical protein